jgi:hypothetical protein
MVLTMGRHKLECPRCCQLKALGRDGTRVGVILGAVSLKQTKEEHERNVFRLFAKASGLSINPRSIRSRREPHPDISFRLNGIPYYFELTRMAHRKLANARRHFLDPVKGYGSAPPPEAYLYNDRTTLKQAIERKAAKRYETSGRPVALLIYIDGLSHPRKCRRRGRGRFLKVKAPTSVGRQSGSTMPSMTASSRAGRRSDWPKQKEHRTRPSPRPVRQ